MPTLLGGCANYYDGPESDHFDGERFFNPGAPLNHGFGDFLRWRFTAEQGPWPDRVENTAHDIPPERVPGAELRVTMINHVTLLIQTGGVNILTDPTWAERASPVSWAGPRRVRPPGLAIEELPPIDVVLVSHNHYDHMNLPTLQTLWQRDRPRILLPLGNDAIVREFDERIRCEPMDWGDRTKVGNDMEIALAPLKHWSARGLFDRNRALWGAFVVLTDQGNVYFAGDTGYGDGENYRLAAREYGPFRLALLPIGAYEPRWFMGAVHMNPEEALRAHRDLGARRSIGIHFGTFPLADDGYEQPLRDLADARRRLGVAEDEFRTLENGRAWIVPAD
ncbi:MAG: MBL fold metallo-hydrolase [Ectothiorhodospiraceae bacterium]